MKFEDLGAAYANNEGMNEVIEDNEEPTIENEDSNGKGPDSLKEAYANNEGMEEVIEDNENLTETRSFEDIGREKLGIASEKASALFDNLLEKGKKTIYNAVGVAFELPKIANETKEVAIEAGTQAYGEAKEVFTGAVNSAKEKVQEVKTNLVERAEKAKTSFFEKITKTKDKYVDKAIKLTATGAVWGIDRGLEVKNKIVETHDRIVEAMRNARVEALKGEIERGEGDLVSKRIRLEMLEKEKAARKNVSSMNRALGNVSGLAV